MVFLALLEIQGPQSVHAGMASPIKLHERLKGNMLYLQVPLHQPITIGPEEITVVHRDGVRYFRIVWRNREYTISPFSAATIKAPTGDFTIHTAPRAKTAKGPSHTVKIGIEAPKHWQIHRPGLKDAGR